MRRGAPTRRLATVLFTDIVGSTEIAAELDDERWRRLKARHHALVREELRRFRGHEVDTAGDGFLTTFEEPTDAVRCAWAISGRVREIGLGIRAGVHTGGVEVTAAGVGGIAIHIAARIMALADGDEILVSATVRDLVAGSGIELEDRGEHDLKGIPGRWRALAVSTVVGEYRPPPLDTDTAAALRRGASEPPPRRRRGGAAVVTAAAAIAVAVALVLVLQDEPQAPPMPPAAARGGVLLEIDPASGDVLHEWPMAGPHPLNASVDLVAGEGAVWGIRVPTTVGTSSLFGGRSVVRIDVATGQITDTTHVAFGATAEVAIGARAVWILSHSHAGGGGKLITQLHSGTGEVLAEIQFTASAASQREADIAVGPDAIWLVTAGGTLVEIDLLDGAVGDTREISGSASDMVVGYGKVWVADDLGNGLIPVDPKTLAPGRPIDVGATPDVVAVGQEAIWIADTLAGAVFRVPVRGGGGVDPPIGVGSEPSDIAVAFGSVWVTNEGDATVSRIDPLTEHVETFDLGGRAPGSITPDEDRGTLWVWAR